MSRRVITPLLCLLLLPLALGACNTTGDLISYIRSDRPDQVVDGPRRVPALNSKSLGGMPSLREDLAASAAAMPAPPSSAMMPMEPPPMAAMEPPAPVPMPTTYPTAVEEVPPPPMPAAVAPVPVESEATAENPAWADRWLGWLKPPAPYAVTPAPAPFALPAPALAEPEPKAETASDERQYAERKPLPGNPPLSLQTEIITAPSPVVTLAQNDNAAVEEESAKPKLKRKKKVRRSAKKAQTSEVANATPEAPADDRTPKPDAAGKSALAVVAPKEEQAEAPLPQPAAAEGKPQTPKDPVVLAQAGEKKEGSSFPKLQDVPPPPPALYQTKQAGTAQRMDLQNTHGNAMQEKTALEQAPFQSIQAETPPPPPPAPPGNVPPALPMPPAPPPPSGSAPAAEERKPAAVTPAPADAAPALPMPPAPPPPPPPSGQRSEQQDVETLARISPAAGQLEEWRPDRQQVAPLSTIVEALPALPSLPYHLPESRYLQRNIAASVHMALE